MLLQRMYNYCSFWTKICSTAGGDNLLSKQNSNALFLPSLLKDFPHFSGQNEDKMRLLKNVISRLQLNFCYPPPFFFYNFI